MPKIIPTAEEIERMSWHNRESAKRTAAAAYRELMAAQDPSTDKLWTVWDSVQTNEHWAAGVRGEAKRLAELMGPDPNAFAHRAAIMEAK